MKFRSPIFIGTLIGVTIALIAFAVFIFNSSYSNGEQIRPYDGKELITDHMKALQTDFSMLLNHYSDQITIISSAFAFIAFLVTYSNTNKIEITARAWGFLSAGVIVLVVSLILSQFGKELLYTMSIRNSVDISLDGLYVSRFTNYFCLIIASVCIGFYALELANNIKKTR
jgi:hypothetical protein